MYTNLQLVTLVLVGQHLASAQMQMPHCEPEIKNIQTSEIKVPLENKCLKRTLL